VPGFSPRCSRMIERNASACLIARDHHARSAAGNVWPSGVCRTAPQTWMLHAPMNGICKSLIHKGAIIRMHYIAAYPHAANMEIDQRNAENSMQWQRHAANMVLWQHRAAILVHWQRAAAIRGALAMGRSIHSDGDWLLATETPLLPVPGRPPPIVEMGRSPIIVRARAARSLPVQGP
jgi:hypothetical protein